MSEPRRSIHDGWTPQPQVQEQPGDPATDPAGLDVERLRDAVAAMASVLVLAERDGQWPYYTAIARRAYDVAGGTLRDARLSVADGPGPEERHWPRWECSSCHRNANQCGERGEGYGGACCNDCDHER